MTCSRDVHCSCNPEGTLRHCDVGKFIVKHGVPATAFPIRVLCCRAVLFLPANVFHDFIAWCAQEWLHLTFMSRDAFRMQSSRYGRSEESGTWVESSCFRPRRFSTKVCNCSLRTMLYSSAWPGLVHGCDRFPASAFLRCYLALHWFSRPGPRVTSAGCREPLSLSTLAWSCLIWDVSLSLTSADLLFCC